MRISEFLEAEINFVDGAIVRTAESIGINAPINHAITELPVQQNATITNPANKICGTEHTRQNVTKANNLFDRQYQTASGYNQPGRSFYTTLRWQPQ